MADGSERRQRRSIRLKGYDYTQSGAYFVTIVTQGRACLFAQVADRMMRLNEDGGIVQSAWDDLPQHYSHVQLDALCVMPNRVHGIICIIGVGAIHESPLPRNAAQRLQMLVPKMIGCFKMISAKRITRLRNTPGIPVWQRNHYKRISRDEGSLNHIREYVANNPLRWDMDRENPAYHRERHVGAVREPHVGAVREPPLQKDEPWHS